VNCGNGAARAPVDPTFGRATRWAGLLLRNGSYEYSAVVTKKELGEPALWAFMC
jgi:hypothetical protein